MATTNSDGITAVIDQNRLQATIQDELVLRRDRIGQVEVVSSEFHDGAWHVMLRPAKQWPGDYAVYLADIEELLVDKLGLNVMLVPANQEN